MPDAVLTDPLGRVLTLHKRTWYAHILRGHPELRHARRFVEAAIEKPLEIRVSQGDPDCRLYFGQSARPGLLVMVVVDVVRAVVKTAHFVRNISGGDLEWSLPTP